MPTFAYTARDAQGNSQSGTLTAADLGEASRLLRAEGKFPIHIQPTIAKTGIRSGGIKLPRNEVIQLSTQLAIMVETGVTIVDAIETVAASSTGPTQKLLQDVSQQVQMGMDFSNALARHPRTFPQLFLSLIKASEKSGMLPQMLQRATTYLRDEQEIVRKVRGALTYPAIMFGFALTTTVFLLIFVLPRFATIYASKQAVLPTPTRLLMGLSDFLMENWMALVIGTGGAVFGSMFAVKYTKIGRHIFNTLQIRLPLVGPMLRQLYLARSLRLIGTMGGAGVLLTECVATARELCGNIYFNRLWQRVEDQLHMGKQLSEPLFQSDLVPRSFAQMIRSAERSGKLAEVMEQVATYSEQELKEKITGLTKYIEPAMIMGMGVIIGSVALALLLPIFTISKVMAK